MNTQNEVLELWIVLKVSDFHVVFSGLISPHGAAMREEGLSVSEPFGSFLGFFRTFFCRCEHVLTHCLLHDLFGPFRRVITSRKKPGADHAKDWKPCGHQFGIRA